MAVLLRHRFGSFFAGRKWPKAAQLVGTNGLLVHVSLVDISDKILKNNEKDGAPKGMKAREDLTEPRRSPTNGL